MYCYRQSEIRKNQASELDEKYAGTRASRSQLYADSEEDQQEDDEDDDDEEELSEGAPGSDLASEDDQLDNEEASIMEDEEEHSDTGSEDEEEEEMSPSKAPRSVGSRAMEEDSRVMLQQLKKASSADVEKGIHVRKQLVSSMLALRSLFLG